MLAPAASCTGWLNAPTRYAAPLPTLMRYTAVAEAPDPVSPPATRTPLPSGATTSRDKGAGSRHGASAAVTTIRLPAPAPSPG